MSKELTTKKDDVKQEQNALSEKIENVLINGNLSGLDADERRKYYLAVCKSLKLNPLTKPFDYITLNGKLQLYANKDCAAQIRKNLKVSINIVSRELIGGVFTVTAKGSADGREDEAIGAVSIQNLRGDALANAYMKCETKAKRRVTLSFCGLGFLDETEIQSIPNAQAVTPTQQKPQQQNAPPPCSPNEYKQADKKRPSREQIVRMFAIARDCGWSKEDIKNYMADNFTKESSSELSIIEYNLLCNEMLSTKEDLPQFTEQDVPY